MKLKLLQSTLYLLSMIALFTGGAVAQSDGAAAAKAKFVNDYNSRNFQDVIADADLLRENNVLDAQAKLVIGQAYFKTGNYAGCVKHVQEAFGIAPSGMPLELLNFCKTRM